MAFRGLLSTVGHPLRASSDNGRYIGSFVFCMTTFNRLFDGLTFIISAHTAAFSAQVGATEYNLRIAGENLEISTYSYGEGLATILDVMQAQLSWIQIYTNAIQAHYSYAVAVADYRRITAVY